MTQSDRDLLEELGAEAAEGESELFAAEEEFASEDVVESTDGEQAQDLLEELEGEESFEEPIEAADEFAVEGHVIRAVGQALAAEGEDEFMGRLARGVAQAFRRAAPVVGKIARAAAPVLSAIPHPAAQIAAQVANLASQLRAEAETLGVAPVATVRRAAEVAAELAAREPRAMPVVAGLVARQLLQNRGVALSPAQRLAAVRRVMAAARSVSRAVGPEGVRALPKIAESVNRTAAAKGTPVAAKPAVLLRTAQRVAQRPDLAARLARPEPRALRLVRGIGGVDGQRKLRFAGPVEITIRAL
ncbi:MAG: hypothetical protein NZP72_13775 [Geminicoccaceae bacterium]|nr:hypothetical protein [Geminicoccaceae bacterium]